MIPFDFITEWRAHAPWADDAQVEQDLILSRALVDIFSDPVLGRSLAFRGGTALHKLHLAPAARYSEDIDLVQVARHPIGPTFTALRRTLAWLGTPKSKVGPFAATLTFAVMSERPPARKLKVKIEINTREHFALDGHVTMPFAVASRWHSGQAQVLTFSLEELLATKLRALYQRKKGRDLFDLGHAGLRRPNPARIMEMFLHYMRHEDAPISRAVFERNLDDKLADRVFGGDVAPLLRHGVPFDRPAAAAVVRTLLAHLP